MNKLLILILIILFLAFVPLGPINYSSELSGIFIFLGELQAMIASSISMLISYIYLLSLALADNALPILMKIYDTIISLPYHQINYWYILLGLFIVSFFKEKFRTINNELNKLRKIMSNSREKDKADHRNKPIEHITILNQKAEAILELLNEISNAAEVFKNNHARTKKIRRANSEVIPKDTNAFKNTSSKDEDLLMRLRKDKTLQENKIDVVTEISDEDIPDTNLAKDEDQLMRLRKDSSLQAQNTDEIMNDDNISQVDLARAYIESNDKEDAIKLIKKIIETGTEEEKHEAQLLYIQVK